MKAKGRLRFDIDTLRDLAGEKVFARGEAYHRDGQVVILSIDPDRVLAQVAGTEDYRTQLIARGKKIDGECSCPAFEDWGFCKHMVATALAANAAGPDAEARGGGALARIRDHLKQKGVEALIDMVMEMAERDAALFRKLELAAVGTDTDDKTLEARLRKAIDGATRTRDFIDYREASGWADNVDTVLDTMGELVTAGRSGLALALAERAIDRIETAIGSIDDSDGHCGALLDRARDIHVSAALAGRPDPIALARDLFAREMADEYDIFHAAASLYADALGEDGLGEYRRLAAEAWEKLSPRRPGRARYDDTDHHLRLADILDFFAERAGDVEARIALRAKNLSSPGDYLRLAQFCREQGREAEALRWAEEGLWTFEDGPPDESLLCFGANLLRKAGRRAEAETHLWNAFDKAPSFELFAQLRKLGGKASRDRVVESLQRRLTNEKRPQLYADLLVGILTHEKMYDAAWAVVHQHPASNGLKVVLARASEASHPREAIEVYAAQVNDLINAGGNRAYADAVKVIAHMAALREAGDHASYMVDLKVRFARKRNFMKLLG